MQPDPIANYLNQTQADQPTKAQAWEVYNHSADQPEFETRLKALNLPNEAKAQLWEMKYGSGAANKPQATTPPVNTPSPQPAAQPAGKGVLGQAWDWANSVPAVFGLKKEQEAMEKFANSPLTNEELYGTSDQNEINRRLADRSLTNDQVFAGHSTRANIQRAEAGFIGDAAKMFVTPLSAALAGVGLLGRVPSALEALGATGKTLAAAKTVGTASRVAGSAAGAGFGVAGGADIVGNSGRMVKQDGTLENDGEYYKRLLGDVAMVAGGTGAALHEVNALRNPTTPGPAPQSSVDPAAQARVNEATGGTPGQGQTATIHVDPLAAAHIDKWQKSDVPNKRVILKQYKNGKQVVQLTHTDPESPGYKYTEFPEKSLAEYQDDGKQDPGKVPVTLYKSDGVRGTNRPGQFLTADVGYRPVQQTAPPVAPTPEVPIAGPETPLPTTAAPAPVVPQPEVGAPPPAPSSSDSEDSGLGFKEAFGSSKGAASDGFAESALDTLSEKGKLPFSENLNSLEGKITAAYKNGIIKTADDVKAVMKAHYEPKVITPADPVRGIQEVQLPVVKPAEPAPVEGGVEPGAKGLPSDIAKPSPNYGYKGKLTPEVAPVSDKPPAEPGPEPLRTAVKNQALGIDEPLKIPAKMKDGTPFTLERDFAGHYKAIDANGKQIGNFSYTRYPSGEWKMAGSEVIPDLRRRGIASAAYDSLEKVVGGKFQNTGSQTDYGRAFWEGRDKQKTTSLPKTAADIPTKPAPDVTPLEDKIRPTIGKLLNLKRLRIGEAVSYTIDRAMKATQTLGESIDPGDAEKLSKLLGELVGKALTGPQTAKLQEMQGITPAGEGRLVPISRETTATRLMTDPAKYQEQQDAHMVNMVQALEDPKTSPGLKAQITKILTTGGYEEGKKDYAFQRGLPKSPEPQATPADHPEAPFTDIQLGSKFSGISSKIYRAIFKGNYKDNYRLDSNDSYAYVKPEEARDLASLSSSDKDLKALQGANNESADATLTPEEQEDLDYVRLQQPLKFDPADFGMGQEDKNAAKGSIFSPEEYRIQSEEYKDARRQLAQKALTRRIATMEQQLKSDVGVWKSQKGPGPTPLTEQLSKLSDEAKKLLPEELFNEKPSTTPIPSASETSQLQESLEEANSAPKKSAPVRQGAQSPSEGIKYTKWDQALKKADPKAYEKSQVIRDATVEKYPVDARQKMYARAMQTFHDGVLNKNPDALLTALETVHAKGEAGYLEIGKQSGHPLLTDEQNRQQNLYAIDNILRGWEDLSQPALLSKGEQLWRREIAARVEGTFPTSLDPVERAAQMEDHNDILARYKALKDSYGTPRNVMYNLKDWSDRILADRPQEGTIRSAMGKLKRDIAIRNDLFESYSKLIDTAPVAANDMAFHAIENGDPIPDGYRESLDPGKLAAHEAKYGTLDIDNLVQRLRGIMDHSRDTYAKTSGNLQDYWENYMAHSYTNVEAARRLARDTASKNPLSGNSDFLKQRTFAFQADAIKAGLDPVTNNWVRRSLLTAAQLDQARFKHDLFNQFKDSGYVSEVKNDKFPPEGWQPIEHPIFTGKDSRYYAPEGVANTFNNFVSKGMGGRWQVPFTKFSLYDAIRYSNSMQNLVQLSFSAFHLSDVVANSMLTNLDVAGRKVINTGLFGKRLGMTPEQRFKSTVDGMKQALSTPFAPIRDLVKGQKINLNFIDPTKEASYLRTTSDLEAANANVRPDMNFHFQQWKMLQDNWSKALDSDRALPTRAMNVVKGTFHAASMVPEIANYPLMKWAIPAMKLGAIHSLLEQVHAEFDTAPPDLLDHQIQKAVDSVDDRFGELNMDNVFWNRSTKDIAHLMTRSFGWTYGTARAIGGGLADVPGGVYRLATGKANPLSSRSSYVGAMVATTMLGNAVMQYMYTGTKAQGIDYLYPWTGTYNKDGEKNRFYPKFLYTYEPINWAHDPIGTAQHKLAPGFASLTDIYKNEDYYHHQIWEPGGDKFKNMQSLLSYVGRSIQPFTLDNIRESEYRGSQAAPSFFGIMPAPQWVGRSPAANLAYSYYMGTRGSSAMDDEQFDKRHDFVQMRDAYINHQINADDLQSAIDKGKLDPKMASHILEEVIDPDTNEPYVSPMLKWLKPLDHSQTWNVWKMASPTEKKILLPAVMQKMATLTDTEQQEKYFNEMEKFENENPQ